MDRLSQAAEVSQELSARGCMDRGRFPQLRSMERPAIHDGE